MLEKKGDVARVLPVPVCVCVNNKCVCFAGYSCPGRKRLVVLGVQKLSGKPAEREKEEPSGDKGNYERSLSVCDSQLRSILGPVPLHAFTSLLWPLP